MDWIVSRERLGAELIGARERVGLRWRQALREYDLYPVSLERCAPELVLRPLHAAQSAASASEIARTGKT